MKIINGDNREMLKTIADNSIDAIVTDPPYGLSFMGKKWDYDVPQVPVFAEMLRVLKPGGHLLCFGGSRTFHRIAVNIEDAGFDIRDTLMWIYGSGFPKSLNVARSLENKALTGNCSKNGFHKLDGERTGDGRIGMYDAVEAQGFRKKNPSQLGAFTLSPTTRGASKWVGWGTALKPAHEPIILARKPLDGTVAANVLKWGVGAINIDGCRVSCEAGDKPGFPDGDYTTDTTVGKIRPNARTADSNPTGRWPANVIHDGSEEVVANFPAATGQLAATRSDGAPMNNKIYGSLKHGTNKMQPRQDSTKSAARFFYCAKTSKADREEGLETFEAAQYSHDGRETPIDNAYQRNSSSSSSNHHPTVKPTALMRYLVKLVTPPRGLILDPYTGSGSTGKAAVLEGFDFLGMEQDPQYCAIARARIEAAAASVTEACPLTGEMRRS